MKLELECPMCGKLCQGETLIGYPDHITVKCDRDGYQARKKKLQMYADGHGW